MGEYDIALLHGETIEAFAQAGTGQTQRARSVFITRRLLAGVVVIVHERTSEVGNVGHDRERKILARRRTLEIDVVCKRDRLVGIGVVERQRIGWKRRRRVNAIIYGRDACAVEQVDRKRNAARGERGRGARNKVHLSGAVADRRHKAA